METGAVYFHKPNEVKRIKIDKDKEIVKKIMKTKQELFPQLEAEYREHLEAIKVAESETLREEIKEQKDLEKAKKVAQLEVKKQ